MPKAEATKSVGKSWRDSVMKRQKSVILVFLNMVIEGKGLHSLVQQHLKNIHVKLDHLPKNRRKHGKQNCLKPPTGHVSHDQRLNNLPNAFLKIQVSLSPRFPRECENVKKGKFCTGEATFVPLPKGITFKSSKKGSLPPRSLTTRP